MVAQNDAMPQDTAARAAALGALLAEDDPRVRKSVVVALGRMDVPEAMPYLMRALEDTDAGVRVLVCQAMARMCDPTVLDVLARHVHDASREVRSGVLWVFANLAAHGHLEPAQKAQLFTPVVILAFDPDDAVRADAAAVLGALGDERTTDPLLVLLEDSCPRVRAAACSSLALGNSPQGYAAVFARLNDPQECPEVHLAALDGCAHAAERGVFAQLTPEVRQMVQKILAYAESEPDMPETPAETPSTTDDVTTDAATADAVTDATAGGDVRVTSADVRASAVWAAGRLYSLLDDELLEDAFRVLGSALEADDVWCVRYSLESLACFHDERAYQLLCSFSAAHTVDGATDALDLDEQTADVLRRARALYEDADR